MYYTSAHCCLTTFSNSIYLAKPPHIILKPIFQDLDYYCQDQ